MNADRLLAHYERIADTPDAIARLRRFILDLAVRGKLVEQNPEDESAAILLAGGKRCKPQESRHADTPGWLVFPVGVLLEFRYGKGKKASERINEGPVPVFGSNGIAGYCEVTLTEAPAIIVGRKGSAGALNLCNGPSWTTDVAYFVEAPNFFELRYLLIGLQALHLESLGKGVKPGLSRSDVYDLPLSVPPLAEQHRIAAKVDELMALCDRLEAARTEREATRDRLAAASHIRLNDPDPDPVVFRKHAAFTLDNLAPLTTRTDQIKALRQTILNLAVRGKLVEQDPNDDPASELLERIAAEKAKISRRPKDLPEIDTTQELGEPPPNWCVVPLIALGSWAIGSGFPKNEQGMSVGPYFFLKVSDMNLPGNEKFITTANNCINDDAATRMRVKIHPPGTIIFPKIGGAIATNKRRLLTKSAAIDNNCLGITFSSQLDVEWAFLLLTTIDFTKYQAGTAVPALQQGTLESIPVGLPPLAEQQRIVAKVDELMALCDRLEKKLAGGDDTRRRLLDALLHEVLVMGADRKSVA